MYAGTVFNAVNMPKQLEAILFGEMNNTDKKNRNRNNRESEIWSSLFIRIYVNVDIFMYAWMYFNTENVPDKYMYEAILHSRMKSGRVGSRQYKMYRLLASCAWVASVSDATSNDDWSVLKASSNH